MQTGRNNLQLRADLAAPPVGAPGSCPPAWSIAARRDAVQLNPARLLDRLTGLRDGVAQSSFSRHEQHRRVLRLTEAVELYAGELLPGCFDDWVLPERQRLAEA